MFSGPRRQHYTVEQFALAYNVTPERVRDWMRRGFLRSNHGRTISESHRLFMERHYGIPDEPKSTLP